MDTLSEKEIFEIAAIYISSELGWGLVYPGQIGRRESDRVEVIFLKPEALEKDTIIDPPDTRVWVNTKTKQVEWIVEY